MLTTDYHYNRFWKAAMVKPYVQAIRSLQKMMVLVVEGAMKRLRQVINLRRTARGKQYQTGKKMDHSAARQML